MTDKQLVDYIPQTAAVDDAYRRHIDPVQIKEGQLNITAYGGMDAYHNKPIRKGTPVQATTPSTVSMGLDANGNGIAETIIDVYNNGKVTITHGANGEGKYETYSLQDTSLSQKVREAVGKAFASGSGDSSEAQAIYAMIPSATSAQLPTPALPWKFSKELQEKYKGSIVPM